MPSGRRRLGDLLLSAGVVSRDQLNRGLERHRESGLRLGEALLDLGLIDGEELAAALSRQLDLPRVSLSEYEVSDEVLSRVPERVARSAGLLPLDVHEGCLYLAMVDPGDVSTLDQIRMTTDLDVQPVVAPPDELKAAVKRLYGGDRTLGRLLEDLPEACGDGVRSGSVSDDRLNEPPVVRYVDRLLLEAVKKGASDLHLEPFEGALGVRRRIDGRLHEVPPPPPEFRRAIVSRVKVMADMDIAETRLPQDGRIHVRRAERTVDFRVSTFPTVHGESVVLRVLHDRRSLYRIGKLGMDDAQRRRFERAVARPHGIVLVTGRTGSGKTTTLYAGLREINGPDRKIITLEDPVEYQLPRLVQTEVDEATGYTFSRGLRSILRQDPDVCLVGEIRDAETANIAVQASLTGHLVLSTVHTSRASDAVVRLLSLGVEPFLLASTLRAVVGQCLVRRVCDECRETYRPDPQDLQRLGQRPDRRFEHTFVRGAGCEACDGTGYRSRTGLFELLEGSPGLARLIHGEATSTGRYERARPRGTSLREHGWQKILRGVTTVEEVLRVVPASSPSVRDDGVEAPGRPRPPASSS